MRNTFAIETKRAVEAVGGLSKPSKMPCHAWSIPAQKCVTGQKLRGVKNSVCEKCYALKGRYLYPNVKNALTRRLEAFASPSWVSDMTQAIDGEENSGFFRWFDSGDLQSLEMLEKIVEVCTNLPRIKFWLPTREYGIVAQYIAKHEGFPKNLNVRLSALLIDGPAPVAIAKRFYLTTSRVSSSDFTCPSSLQGGKCLTCRACWDKSVENVNYKKH